MKKLLFVISILYSSSSLTLRSTSSWQDIEQERSRLLYSAKKNLEQCDQKVDNQQIEKLLTDAIEQCLATQKDDCVTIIRKVLLEKLQLNLSEHR